MQPVRVIIAAIFFVIGALIVIPAFTGGNGTSDAASTTEPTATEPPPSSASPPPSPASGSPEPSKSAPPAETRPASPSPSSPPPSTTPSPSPSRSTPAPSAPPAVPTTPAPAAPLTVSFGKIDCPSDKVTVKVTNDTDTAQGYAITRNGSIVLADRLGPNASRTSSVTLAEDRRVVVRVTWDGRVQASRAYRLNCLKAGAAEDRDETAAERLPHTGADDTVLVARIATGVASMITGAIVLWWGGLWPRRRENVFGRADRG